MPQRRKRTPWDRIIRAADAGRGLKLSPDEVLALSRDGAIETRATLDSDCFAKGHDPMTCADPDCED